jgi:predicted Na+-dependent transporter
MFRKLLQEEAEETTALDDAFTYMLAVLIFLMMLGMGATVTTETVKKTIKKPFPFLIGFLSQYGLMPLLTFAMAYVFGLSNLQSIGLVITGCSPGGVSCSLGFAH